MKEFPEEFKCNRCEKYVGLGQNADTVSYVEIYNVSDGKTISWPQNPPDKICIECYKNHGGHP